MKYLEPQTNMMAQHIYEKHKETILKVLREEALTHTQRQINQNTIRSFTGHPKSQNLLIKANDDIFQAQKVYK